MISLHNYIQQHMTDNGKKSAPILTASLLAASMLYAGAISIRNYLYDRRILPIKRLPCCVISIGNLSSGGTGKTPMTQYIACFLNRLGYRPVILSRGYKGLAEKKGGLVSDGVTLFMSSIEAGDEPYMMASHLKNIPVRVGKNRFISGLKAIDQFHPDILILDDGFQHRRLHRTIELTLIDARRLFGNGRLLPYGPLREPVSALKRSDALILTRCDDPSATAPDVLVRHIAASKPIFRSVHEPVIRKIIKANSGKAVDCCQTASADRNGNGKTVVAFSGLADNTAFHHSIKQLQFKLHDVAEFPDHHRFTNEDFAAIFRSARHADALITTEKDYARIAPDMRFPLDLYIIGIDISFGNDSYQFHQFLINQMLKANGV